MSAQMIARRLLAMAGASVSPQTHCDSDGNDESGSAPARSKGGTGCTSTPVSGPARLTGWDGVRQPPAAARGGQKAGGVRSTSVSRSGRSKGGTGCASTPPARDWARSGVLQLTGRADAPPALPTAPLATVAAGAALALAVLAPPLRGLDGARLLGERAAFEARLTRRGRISAGGTARLLRARDGFVAVNLPRGADDFRLLPAWLGIPLGAYASPHPFDRAKPLPEALHAAIPFDPAAPVGCAGAAGTVADVATVQVWDAIRRAIPGCDVRTVVARARLLGLPVAPAARPSPHPSPWLQRERAGARGARKRAVRVLDLSALWAGPLCAQLLAHAGARVIKVESRRRPDALRRSSPAFFALLNGEKEQLALDFDTAAGRRALDAQFAAADVVLEASRPRALEQLGFDARAWLAARPGRVWCSITGYGRSTPGGGWVALGDDAAAAAGLCYCVAESDAPLFVGDAIADPLAGLHAAVAILAAQQRGGGELLDLRLQGVVAHAIAQRDIAPVTGRVVAEGAGFAVADGAARWPIEAAGCAWRGFAPPQP